DRATVTDRVLMAISHASVVILAHPAGRRINRRSPFERDVEAVLEAAAELCVAVELNANPGGLAQGDVHVRRGKELGVPVVVSTDAHTPGERGNMRFGVDQARRGWLGPRDVLNARPRADFERWLRRREA